MEGAKSLDHGPLLVAGEFAQAAVHQEGRCGLLQADPLIATCLVEGTPAVGERLALLHELIHLHAVASDGVLGSVEDLQCGVVGWIRGGMTQKQRVGRNTYIRSLGSDPGDNGLSSLGTHLSQLDSMGAWQECKHLSEGIFGEVGRGGAHRLLHGSLAPLRFLLGSGISLLDFLPIVMLWWD